MGQSKIYFHVKNISTYKKYDLNYLSLSILQSYSFIMDFKRNVINKLTCNT